MEALNRNNWLDWTRLDADIKRPAPVFQAKGAGASVFIQHSH